MQSVDLTERSDVLRGVDPRGGVFLGCVFRPAVEDYLRRSGALLFPRLPDVPFDPYRAQLYELSCMATNLRRESRRGDLCLVQAAAGTFPHRGPGGRTP